MNQTNNTFSIEITETPNRCPIGETVGQVVDSVLAALRNGGIS